MCILMYGDLPRNYHWVGLCTKLLLKTIFLGKFWVYFLKQKSEVFVKFKLWKAEVENQTDRKIKYLRSDNRTKYKDSQLLKFCEEYEIQRHFTVHKIPQQNDIAERMNMSLNERALCLRLNAWIPKSFWEELVSMPCYLINRSPRASLGDKVAEKSLDDVSFIFLLLYVDDMSIPAKNMFDVIGLKALLSQEFDMKDLEVVKKILGMEIHRDRGSRKLWLSQQGYVEKVLDRFGMSNAKPVSTSFANHFKLSSEQCLKTYMEIEEMTKVPYPNVVGCLMYAMGTMGHGIVFGSQQHDPLIVGYVDSNYAGDLDDRRSTLGMFLLLVEDHICWKSTVRSIVALLTTEVEYMVVAEAAKEAL
ncbi:hypothetical protein GQ457_08G037420 [Hibiscus cannabinus]